jgi:hypothetical protein
MPRKPQRPRKTSDPEQLKRFIATAREVEVDESPEAMDRALNKVIPRSSAKADVAVSRPVRPKAHRND